MINPSQRPLPDNTQHSQQTNIQAMGGIRTHHRSRRAALDLRLRPRGHWRVAWFSSEIDEKLIELVRKCEKLYDISNKKYSDSVWKEKLWEQIGEELKNQVSSSVILLRILKLLSFYYHRIFFWLSRWAWDTTKPRFLCKFCFSPASETAQMNSPTSSSMVTYYRQSPSELNK